MQNKNRTGIGGMEVRGERESRNDENCETEKTKLIYNVIDKDCGIIIM